MNKPLRILLIEDSEDDALLLMRELKRGGFNPEETRIQTEEQLLSELIKNEFDIAISDYVLPGYSGMEALELVKKYKPGLPFIMISGKVGEEFAVEAMRHGGHDYITKDNLARLIPAIKRELGEAQLRIEHRKTQAALEQAQKEMEKQRQREQEMKLLAQLVSGVAHEVRNPLNAISSLIEAMFLEIGEPQGIDPYRRHLHTQIERLNRLMQDLLELGKPDTNDSFMPINMDEFCKKVTDSWNHAVKIGSVKVEFVKSESIYPMKISGDKDRLQQVFVNLLENAAHHSPPSSTIQMVLNANPETVSIEIVDSGTGIADEIYDRIFEPFFTTRKAGTGLGLGIARRIVEAHGGSIKIENNIKSQGVTATVLLPQGNQMLTAQ